MRRDLDAHQDPVSGTTIRAPGYSPEQVSYHVKLLQQAGLIEAENVSPFQGFAWVPTSLTWQGHEFLDAARSERVWHKVKAELKDRGLSVPFELVQQLALKITGAMLGL